MIRTKVTWLEPRQRHIDMLARVLAHQFDKIRAEIETEIVIKVKPSNISILDSLGTVLCYVEMEDAAEDIV